MASVDDFDKIKCNNFEIVRTKLHKSYKILYETPAYFLLNNEIFYHF